MRALIAEDRNRDSEAADAEAMAELINRAENGESGLFVEIADLYQAGWNGQAPNHERAVWWFERAICETKHPRAYLGLGRAMLGGEGLSQDLGAAQEYFLHALTKGVDAAAVYLGMMRFHGRGCSVDLQGSQELFSRAWNAGYPVAGLYLARLARLNGKWMLSAKLSVQAWQCARRLPNHAERLLGWDSTIVAPAPMTQ